MVKKSPENARDSANIRTFASLLCISCKEMVTWDSFWSHSRMSTNLNTESVATVPAGVGDAVGV